MDARAQALRELRADVFAAHAYPTVLVMEDGESLCIGCARSEWWQIIHDTAQRHFGVSRHPSGWAAMGLSVHWEGPPEHCAHCNREIESAYGDPEEDE